MYKSLVRGGVCGGWGMCGWLGGRWFRVGGDKKFQKKCQVRPHEKIQICKKTSITNKEFASIVRLPNQVYELVNKRTKFTVVSVCLPTKFRWRVRFPARFYKKSILGLPKVCLPITSGWVRLPRASIVCFPKVRLPAD